jgi:hypothetical protein
MIKCYDLQFAIEHQRSAVANSFKGNNELDTKGISLVYLTRGVIFWFSEDQGVKEIHFHGFRKK